MTTQTERIDGTDYEVGSADYSVARGAYTDRMDADYVEAHSDEIRETQERLSGWDALGCHADANATAFLARDLLFVRREVEKIIYDRLRAAEFVPVVSEVPAGAKTYTTRIMDRVGEKALITHDLAGDGPRADVSVEEDEEKLINVRASYAYSLQDMEYAAFAGVPLSRDRAEAAADMIARGLDEIGRIGNAAAGLTGFFNDTNVATLTLTNGEWTTASAAEILADLAQIEAAMISQSRDNHEASELVLPTVYEGRLVTLDKSVGSDLSVKNYFLANSRMIKNITRWFALDEATGADVGVSDPPMGILYPRTPDVLRWEIPIMYMENPPEVRAFEWVVNARARTGGVEVRRPLSMLYIENLD